MKLILNWNSWNTGGNCIVYTKDVELLDGRTVSLGVSDECVVLYPHIWTNFSDWDTGEYLFTWYYDESELDLHVILAMWLKDGSKKDDLVEDIAKIMAHLG